MGAIDDIEAQYGDDLVAAAKDIGRRLVCGNSDTRGYPPRQATILALNVTGFPKTIDEILQGREPMSMSHHSGVYAHLLGFHDALLRDRKPGYKVPNGGGADYEEGHRIGAELDRDALNFFDREEQHG